MEQYKLILTHELIDETPGCRHRIEEPIVASYVPVDTPTAMMESQIIEQLLCEMGKFYHNKVTG